MSEPEHIHFDTEGSKAYFRVDDYVKAQMRLVDEKLEAEIIARLRDLGWTVERPQGGLSPDDLWWRVRGAIMKETVGLGLDYETRSRIAEDAARDVKESVKIETEGR